jgi:LSD1 subclass zinc finger protein
MAGMIPQDLLDILVCPVCKKPLQLKEAGESLKCTECRRVYPVRDNIPILLVDEAVTEPS